MSQLQDHEVRRLVRRGVHKLELMHVWLELDGVQSVQARLHHNRKNDLWRITPIRRPPTRIKVQPATESALSIVIRKSGRMGMVEATYQDLVDAKRLVIDSMWAFDDGVQA